MAEALAMSACILFMLSALPLAITGIISWEVIGYADGSWHYASRGRKALAIFLWTLLWSAFILSITMGCFYHVREFHHGVGCGCGG